MVCAALLPKEEGDTYIDDRLHYQLSIVSRAILADAEHETNGLWHWVFDGEGGPHLRAKSEIDSKDGGRGRR